MNDLTLAVDIDATIYDPQPLYSRAAEMLFPKIGGYAPEDVLHYDWLEERYGPSYWNIFNEALHPKNMCDREMYPGCMDVLRTLRDEYDTNLYFVTYNREAEIVRRPLKRWIAEHLGDDNFKLAVTKTGDKAPILERIGAFGIVDDKVATLREAVAAELYAATMYQTWNREYVNSTPEVEGFEDWNEARDILINAVEMSRIPKGELIPA